MRRALLAWYRKNRRDLPWRRTRDPYAIWVSEAMLQQTRVAAVIPYYERFLRAFPDLAALARASEERVLGHWAGLGYYRRARHLRAAAAVALERHGGALPEDPLAFAALPGVGRYTMGAVYSIAFGHRLAVVDGNVIRVLARVFALADDPGEARGRERFWALAKDLVPEKHPGDFNQAIMELGATVCTPPSPACSDCPLAARCRARELGRAAEFPRLRPRAAARRVRAAAALLESRRGFYLERVASGPNRGMLDPPSAAGESALRRRLTRAGFRLADWRALGTLRHGILDRSFVVSVFRASVAPASRARGEWLSRRRLRTAPLTARARKALALEGV
jgi:A/G-specific adenine glycosylase